MTSRIRGKPKGLWGRQAGILAAVSTLGFSLSAHAWLVSDHQRLTRIAVQSLPDSMPEFFRKAWESIGEISGDPDLHKDQSTPVLREREYPEHFLDSELLKGRKWPASYFEFMKALYSDGQSPAKVGSLPYAILSGVEKLTLTFALLRKHPESPALQAKAIVYAGNLGHYAADLCQPLHTTVHFDGRAKKNGDSPRTGIHLKVDGLPRRVTDLKPLTLKDLGKPLPTFREHLEAAFQASFAAVDRTYALESKLPGLTQRGKSDSTPLSPDVLSFARERSEASIRFTAELFWLAWLRSGEVQIPDYLFD